MQMRIGKPGKYTVRKVPGFLTAELELENTQSESG